MFNIQNCVKMVVQNSRAGFRQSQNYHIFIFPSIPIFPIFKKKKRANFDTKLALTFSGVKQKKLLIIFSCNFNMISFFIVFLNLGAKLLAFQHIETGLQRNPHF